jgi:hypothetical protein
MTPRKVSTRCVCIKVAYVRIDLICVAKIYFYVELLLIEGPAFSTVAALPMNNEL